MANQDFDWLTIDAEHGLFDLQNIAAIVDAIHSKSCSALIRIPECNGIWIRRCLDAGVDGIIVPMVNDKSIAEEAIRYCKYPPLGERGFGFSHTNCYGADFQSYVKEANDKTTLIVQIEHIKGVENIDSILSLEEIDGVIIGPYDLAGSMGHTGQPDHPEVKKACLDILAGCQRHNKAPGIHVVKNDISAVKEEIAKGFKFIAYGIDALFLGAAGNSLKELK
jgi:2-dehydro-3-deoxyglucarate aldolase